MQRLISSPSRSIDTLAPVAPSPATAYIIARPTSTKSAPAASAFTTCSPERTPLSIRSGKPGPTAARISGSTSIVAGSDAGGRPPAVVGDDDAVAADLARLERILGGEQALDHDLPLPALAQFLHVVPVEAAGDLRRHEAGDRLRPGRAPLALPICGSGAPRPVRRPR